jgi:hypothetical protein
MRTPTEKAIAWPGESSAVSLIGWQMASYTFAGLGRSEIRLLNSPDNQPDFSSAKPSTNPDSGEMAVGGSVGRPSRRTLSYGCPPAQGELGLPSRGCIDRKN